MPDKKPASAGAPEEKRRGRKTAAKEAVIMPLEAPRATAGEAPAPAFERAPPPSPASLPGLRSPLAGSRPAGIAAPALTTAPPPRPAPAPAPQPRMVTVDVRTLLFDPVYYLTKNPDVAAQGIDPVTHYLSFGWNEGRDPNPYFDSAFYLKSNPDVVSQGLNPFFHFLFYGAREGRAPKG